MLSKNAITTLAFVIRALSNRIDSNSLMENILHPLFLKVSDKSKFLSSAAEQAIKIIVNHSRDSKVICAITSFDY